METDSRKVYVVVDDDGDGVLGVYSSEEDANLHRELVSLNANVYTRDIDENVEAIRSGKHFYTVVTAVGKDKISVRCDVTEPHNYKLGKKNVTVNLVDKSVASLYVFLWAKDTEAAKRVANGIFIYLMENPEIYEKDWESKKRHYQFENKWKAQIFLSQLFDTVGLEE